MVTLNFEVNFALWFGMKKAVKASSIQLKATLYIGICPCTPIDSFSDLEDARLLIHSWKRIQGFIHFMPWDIISYILKRAAKFNFLLQGVLRCTSSIVAQQITYSGTRNCLKVNQTPSSRKANSFSQNSIHPFWKSESKEKLHLFT